MSKSKQLKQVLEGDRGGCSSVWVRKGGEHHYLFSGEEGGTPSKRSGGIPILNITGAKVDRWMSFTQSFKPAG